MANYGIKVGTDINTDTDLTLKLTSKFSSLKMFKWGNAQFTTDGSGGGSVTINHGLGYTPIAMVFKKCTAQYTFLSSTQYSNAFRQVGRFLNSYDTPQMGFHFSTDDTNLTISTVTPFESSHSPSTTYYFRYIIFVDKSEAFSSASNISLTGDYGFKISKSGKEVTTAEEYDMALSSKYKSLQYYEGHIESSSLTLPEMWATKTDTTVEEATYVDFNHNLGYPPFFLVYSDLDTAYLYETPYFDLDPSGLTYKGIEEVSSWCDSSRVRVLFRRKSISLDDANGTEYSEKAISINVIIFAESLTGSESP